MEFFKKHQFKIIAVVLSLLLICIICLFVFPKGGNNDKEDVYYTVTFNSVGGTVVNRQTILEGERITEPITPQKEGYTFLGWYLDGIKYNFNKTVYKDINLVAKWKITSETNENLEEEKDEVEDTDKKEEENTSNNSQPSQNKPTEDKKDNTVGVTGITLDKTSLSLDVGASSTLTATVKPSNATNKKVTWKSSDTSIVTVSNGEVKAVGAGSATITATANTCFQFHSWNDGNTENPRVIELDSDTNLVAIFGEIRNIIDTTINEGEVYTDYGFNESEEGTYYQYFTTDNGCDSVIVLNLSVNVSLNDVEECSLSLYPNPTSKELYFSDMIKECEVMDFTGKRVMKFYNTKSINIESLPAGFYYLKLIYKDKILIKKVIKQ